MKFSTSMEYAMHGIVYLARDAAEGAQGETQGSIALISDIASAIKVPEPYLRKVFQQLTRSGILSSQRGARGGFRLAKPSEEITLKDIVESIDGSLPGYSCLKVDRGCRLSSPCPVQGAFELAREKMGEVLQSVSVRHLLTDIGTSTPEVDWLKVTA